MNKYHSNDESSAWICRINEFIQNIHIYVYKKFRDIYRHTQIKQQFNKTSTT
jgi:hypothetical protein